MVRLNFERRLKFYDGPFRFAPGIEIDVAPGHPIGLQYLRYIPRGWVTLAGDVTSFYEKVRATVPSLDYLIPGMILSSWKLTRRLVTT